MMDEKILERMLNSLIEEAGPIAIENMEKEANLEDVPDVEFSEKHEAKMQEIFEMARRKEIASEENTGDIVGETEDVESKIVEADFSAKSIAISEKKRTHKHISVKKIAVVLAATIVISGLTITSVSAWRESFSKYFLDKKEKYSDVKDFKPGIEMYVGNIYFGYIPEGFVYIETKDTNTINGISFGCGDKYFVLKEYENEWITQINTESGEVEDIIINETEMVYYENETRSMKSINWKENGTTYLLYSNCDRNTLEQIAKCIKIY